MSLSPPEHQVVLEPAEFKFFAQNGEPLMHAAQRAGIKWPTICGGKAECGVCYIELLEGAAHTSRPLLNEQHRLALTNAKPLRGGEMRLACQLRVLGDVRVYRPLIRVPRTHGEK